MTKSGTFKAFLSFIQRVLSVPLAYIYIYIYIRHPGTDGT
jgi:hypothetical protein